MRCSRCKRSEPDVVFTSKTSGYCKECFRDYRRERYVPVAERSAKKRIEDAAWGARHDAKTCSVCQRNGGADVIFRGLSHKRCSACMAKGLFRCKTHGVMRKTRCPKCQYAAAKGKAERISKAKVAKELRNIFTVRGDGTCGQCGASIRVNGQIDRGHRCG